MRLVLLLLLAAVAIVAIPAIPGSPLVVAADDPCATVESDGHVHVRPENCVPENP